MSEILDRIQLWYAFSVQRKRIITIFDVKDNEEYYCPICNGKVIPKAVNSSKMCPHFAHMDKSKCNSESMAHWWFKNKFIQTGDEFTVKTKEERKYTCKEFDVEKSYTINNKRYKPDLTVVTECGEQIYFEFKNTNSKKTDDYIELWNGLGNIVVEINIKDLLNKNGYKKEFNALYYKGKTFIKHKKYTRMNKYIEEHGLLDYEDAKYLNRLRKINWFWTDALNYKENIITIGDFIESIKGLEEDDCDLIKTFFDAKSCISLKEKYMSEICDYLERVNISTVKYIKENCKSYETKPSGNDIKICYKDFNHDYINAFSNDFIFNFNNKILEIKREIEMNLLFVDVIKNKTLDVATVNINNKINLINSNYKVIKNIKLTDFSMILNYADNLVLSIDISDQSICCSDNPKIIEDYVCEAIDLYRDDLNCTIDEKFIVSTVAQLEKLYKEVYVIDTYDRVRFLVKYDLVSESKINIGLYTENTNKYEREIISLEYENNKFDFTTYTNKNLNKLENHMVKIFNFKIRQYIKDEEGRIYGRLPYELK